MLFHRPSDAKKSTWQPILSSGSSVLGTAERCTELQAAVDPAVRQNGLAGYVGSSLRGQPHDNVCNFFGIAQPSDRRFRGPRIANLLGGLPAASARTCASSCSRSVAV